MTTPEGFGHNDDDGNVFCHLCEWRKACGPNMELIEAALKAHLEEAHKLPCLYRVDDDGKRTEIPQ